MICWTPLFNYNSSDIRAGEHGRAGLAGLKERPGRPRRQAAHMAEHAHSSRGVGAGGELSTLTHVEPFYDEDVLPGAAAPHTAGTGPGVGGSSPVAASHRVWASASNGGGGDDGSDDGSGGGARWARGPRSYSKTSTVAAMHPTPIEPQQHLAAASHPESGPAVPLGEPGWIAAKRLPPKLSAGAPLLHQKSFMKRRPPRDWRRDKLSVDAARSRLRAWAALVGMLGTVFSIAQNELILRGYDPQDWSINTLKCLNTLCSGALFTCLCRIYMLFELSVRIKMHLTALHPLDIHVSPRVALMNRRFWCEALVSCVHLVPFWTFELVMYNWTNIVMYRAETLGAVFNTLRIYLVWPVIRDQILSSLPKRTSISAFTKTPMGSAFAAKVIMNNTAASMLFIGSCWAVTYILTGYWFRAAEISACLLPSAKHPLCSDERARLWRIESDAASEFEKTNDLYVWNAMWCMLITSTSVGYGDILTTTHIGRFVAIFAAMSGIVGAAMLTATFAALFHWSEAEISAMLVIEREQARQDVRQLGAKVIQGMAHRKATHSDHDAGSMRKSWELRQAFRRAKAIAQRDLDDCLSDQKKLETCFQHIRYIEEASAEIELSMLDKGSNAQLKVPPSPLGLLNPVPPKLSSATPSFSGFGSSSVDIMSKIDRIKFSRTASFNGSQPGRSQKFDIPADEPSRSQKFDIPADDDSEDQSCQDREIFKKEVAAGIAVRAAHQHGWTEIWGGDGKKMYHHTVSGITQMVKPAVMARAEEDEERSKEEARTMFSQTHGEAPQNRQMIATSTAQHGAELAGNAVAGGSNAQVKLVASVQVQNGSNKGLLPRSSSTRSLRNCDKKLIPTHHHSSSMRSVRSKLPHTSSFRSIKSVKSMSSTGSGHLKHRIQQVTDSAKILHIRSALHSIATKQQAQELVRMVRSGSDLKTLLADQHKLQKRREVEAHDEDEPAEVGVFKTFRVTKGWRHKRGEIASRQFHNDMAGALLAFLGTMCAIAQNEFVMRNNDPHDSRCNILKVVHSLISILLVFVLFRHYWLLEVLRRLVCCRVCTLVLLRVLLMRLHARDCMLKLISDCVYSQVRHLRYGQVFNPDVDVRLIASCHLFWLECLVSCTHLPPFLTGEVRVSMMENVVVYRQEMIWSCWNLLRIYLLWRPFKAWMTQDIPNKHYIAETLNIRFETLFVLKRIVNSWMVYTTTCSLVLAFHAAAAPRAHGPAPRCTLSGATAARSASRTQGHLTAPDT